MKLLAVDIGNTNTKFTVITDGVLGEIKRAPTENIDALAEEIAQSTLPIALCSVRAGAAAKVRNAIDKYGAKLLLEVGAHIVAPVSGFYAGMGADRIADVAAAWTEMDPSSPVAVIGLGTGTTITTVSADGKFRGGFTTLGLDPICQTLTRALPALPPIDPGNVDSLELGFDVYSALSRGTLLAHVGLIEKWVSVVREHLGENLPVVATGGWSELISRHTACIDRVDPLLTLKGIWRIAQSNVQA